MMQQTLIQWRAERNLTQERLAKEAGVSMIIIYRMEHGIAVARESAEKVAKVLGVSLEQLAGVVFSKPLAERVNRNFVRSASARKRA